MELESIIEAANLTHQQGRELCQKTDRQWRRYRSGDTPFPQELELLILTVGGGYLGGISPAWSNYRIDGDHLVDQFERRYSVEWLEGLHWYHEKLAAERARLRQQVRELQGQPFTLEAIKKGAL